MVEVENPADRYERLTQSRRLGFFVLRFTFGNMRHSLPNLLDVPWRTCNPLAGYPLSS